MHRTTLYTSRRVCLPPVVAATAFDALRLAHVDSPRSPSWSVVAPSAVLVLDSAGLLLDDSALALRQVVGRLSGPAGRRGFPVEVEVTAWSRLRSEVGVRPVGRWVRLDDGWRQQRYLRLAHALADHIAAALEGVVATWGDERAAEALAGV